MSPPSSQSIPVEFHSLYVELPWMVILASHRFAINTHATLDRQFPSVGNQSHSPRIQNVRITKSPEFPSNYRKIRIQFAVDESARELLNGEEEDDDDDLCPVECVKEFKTDDEFGKILDKAKENQALVVVDFYRTSCGSCKYIEQGFSKICKGAGDEDAPVIFLKHNVMDEYEEQSEVAERLRIKTVPLFHFYKGGALLESFATRDKERINAAILRYTSPAFQES